MLPNRLIFCVCCIFLAYVSATEALEVDKKTQDDFDTVSDTIDFHLAHIKDPEELLARLGRNLEDNKFIDIWNEVRRTKRCGSESVSGLSKINQLANPSEEFGRPTISKMVHKHFMRALEICSKDFENDFEEFIADEDFTEEIIKLLSGPAMSLMLQECGPKDEFCLNKTIEVEKFANITKIIYGSEIGGKQEINRVKLSHKMLKIEDACDNIGQYVKDVLEIMAARGLQLGPNPKEIMRLLFVCRSLADREHLHIDHLAELNGEPHRPTPCYRIRFSSDIPVRRICPTSANHSNSYEGANESSKFTLVLL